MYVVLYCFLLLLQALEAIETAIKAKAARPKLAELTSKFYTIIPHDFGRQTPSVIAESETLQKKFDMLVVCLTTILC